VFLKQVFLMSNHCKKRAIGTQTFCRSGAGPVRVESPDMALTAALPGLVLGQPLLIYATNNSGNPYNIGFILGINACGTVFLGVAFWQRRAGRSEGKWHPPSPRLRRTGMADGNNG
jgi:hypothetical protein